MPRRRLTDSSASTPADHLSVGDRVAPLRLPRPRPAPDTSRPRPRRPTLATAFDPRHNSLNALRLALAIAVLASHSWVILYDEADPFGRLPGAPDLGTFAVDGFFLLSGFLITRSHLRASSTGRFFWHRFLRIMPGFWVCLLLTTVVVAPLLWWMERGTGTGFPWTGPESALTFGLGNALLRIHQFHIGDLLGGLVVNAPLHTLFFEALCYLMIGVLGALGVLRTRPIVVAMLAAGGWLFALADAVAGSGLHAETYTVKYTSVFLIGAVMFRYADRVPLTRPLVAASLALLAAALLIPGYYQVLGPIPLAYLLLAAGTSRRLARVGSHRDLSYGIYIYGWPIQLFLAQAGIGANNVGVHIAASISATAVAAYASWRLVEEPALARKCFIPGVLTPRSRPAGGSG